MAPFALPSLPSFPTLPPIPSLSSFPSVSSMYALIDTEPKLFYPAPKSPTRPRPRERRDSSSSIRSSSSGHTQGDLTPQRAHRPYPHLGHLDRASRSAVDLSEWQGVEDPLRELGRRHSLSLGPGDTTLVGANGVSAIGQSQHFISKSTDIPSPSRPAHKRSRSALPGPSSAQAGIAPVGRLYEFSRNPLASSSAISLPTLAEGETEEGVYESRANAVYLPHPGARLHRRSSSRTSSVTNTTATSSISILASPASLAFSVSPPSLAGSLPRPISPLSLALELDVEEESSTDEIDCDHRMDNTPKAKRKGNPILTLTSSSQSHESSSVPPPQRVARLLRPPPSLRSWTDPNFPTQQCIRSSSSLALPHGRAVSAGTGAGTASVSDVAVMATWSTSGIGAGALGVTRGSGVGASDGLRERLRSLSMLDVNDASEVSNESPIDQQRNLLSPESANSEWRTPHLPSSRPLVRASTTSEHHRAPPFPRIQHRHTHSSPHTLLSPPMQPPFDARSGRIPFPASVPVHHASAATPSTSLSRSSSPGRPGHRRTTSRLRSPQLLSLPLEPPSVYDLRQTRSHQLGDASASNDPVDPWKAASSLDGLGSAEAGPPGMLSRCDSTASLASSDTCSLVRTRSAADAVPQRGKWWQPRRYSISGEQGLPFDNAGEGEGKRAVGGEGEVEGDKMGRQQRGDSPENERFIDFDDI